ncbi:MAG: hypothetical protein ACYDAP_01410 [Thermoplasmataceae archaeon]
MTLNDPARRDELMRKLRINSITPDETEELIAILEFEKNKAEKESNISKAALMAVYLTAATYLFSRLSEKPKP